MATNADQWTWRQIRIFAVSVQPRHSAPGVSEKHDFQHVQQHKPTVAAIREGGWPNLFAKDRVVGVLVLETLSLAFEGDDRRVAPPLHQISVFVEKSAWPEHREKSMRMVTVTTTTMMTTMVMIIIVVMEMVVMMTTTTTTMMMIIMTMMVIRMMAMTMIEIMMTVMMVMMEMMMKWWWIWLMMVMMMIMTLTIMVMVMMGEYQSEVLTERTEPLQRGPYEKDRKWKPKIAHAVFSARGIEDQAYCNTSSYDSIILKICKPPLRIRHFEMFNSWSATWKIAGRHSRDLIGECFLYQPSSCHHAYRYRQIHA